jgi:hypothetical protein
MSQFILPSRATDANNNPLSGALLYFYLEGTTTPTSVYSDAERTVEHANPVVADSGGQFPAIYTAPGTTYRATLKTAAGVTIADFDPYEGDELDNLTVEDYGALTGATDNKAAFEAMNAAQPSIVVPEGAFALATAPTLTKPLEIMHGATLTGAGAAPLGYTSGAMRQTLLNGTAGTDFALRYFRRNADHVGGSSAFVCNALRVETYVETGVTNLEWNATFKLNNLATGGENTAMYALANKATTNAGATIGGVIDLDETVAINDQITSSVGLEVDHRSNGTDSSNSRVVLDVYGGKYNSAGVSTEIGYGVRIQTNGDTTGVLFKTGYGFQAGVKTNVGFDASLGTHSLGAFKVTTNQAFIWSADNTKTLYHSGSALVLAVSGVVKTSLLDAGGVSVGANQIIGARKTGWGIPSGTADRTTFDTATVTTAQLAQRLKALIEDLSGSFGHGLIGS